MSQPPPDATPAQVPAGDTPAPPPASSGRWSPVGRHEHRVWTQADYDWWIERDRDGSVLAEAMDAGRLAGIGIGPRSRRYGRNG